MLAKHSLSIQNCRIKLKSNTEIDMIYVKNWQICSIIVENCSKNSECVDVLNYDYDGGCGGYEL